MCASGGVVIFEDRTAELSSDILAAFGLPSPIFVTWRYDRVNRVFSVRSPIIGGIVSFERSTDDCLIGSTIVAGLPVDYEMCVVRAVP